MMYFNLLHVHLQHLYIGTNFKCQYYGALRHGLFYFASMNGKHGKQQECNGDIKRSLENVQCGRRTKRCHCWIFHPWTHRKQWQWLEDPTATLQHTPVSQSSTSSQRTGPPVFCEGVSYLEVQTSRARPGQIPESVPWKGKTRISDYVSRGFALNHTLLQTCSIRRRGTIAALQGLRTGVESPVSGPKDTK